jgi:hypothetical protein
MFYEDNFFDILTYAGELTSVSPARRYRLDKSHEQFYFFAKCPEDVLDVRVYSFEAFELHEVETTSFTPKRFLFVRPAQIQTVDDLNTYMFTNGFQLKDGVYHSRQLVAFSYEDGIVFAARSCRKNFEEAPGTKIR